MYFYDRLMKLYHLTSHRSTPPSVLAVIAAGEIEAGLLTPTDPTHDLDENEDFAQAVIEYVKKNTNEILWTGTGDHPSRAW